MHIVTDAVVLRAYEGGRNSRLLILLTREHGRIAAVARGAGSLKSALCAASGQFCYASFVLFRNADKYVVDSADIKELFYELREDVTRLAAAQYMAEVCGELAREEEPDEALLRILLNSLYALCKLNLSPALCKAVFELKAAAAEGYQPDLSACAVCGGEPAGGVSVDALEGIMRCAGCAPAGGTGIRLSGEALGTLREVFSLPVERMFSFSASGAVMGEIAFFAERYLLMQTELRPKTLSFFNTLLQGDL